VNLERARAKLPQMSSPSTESVDSMRCFRKNQGSKPDALVTLALLASDPDALLRDPRELFKACMDREQLLERTGIKAILRSIDRFFLFDFPLFEDKPGDFANGGYPLQFTITRPEDAKGPNAEWRYTELLRHLKKLHERELRWLLIARWLDEEDVCEPEEFFPERMLEQMLKRHNAQMMCTSPADLFHSYLVRIWHPYFSNLLADLRGLPKNYRRGREALVKRGYEPLAVEYALGLRSAVRATVGWLDEVRGKGEARTLENAYSRVKVLRARPS
jgi:hypothetical protein